MGIVTPHDLFFKEIFSNQEYALDLIKATFPQSVLKSLDLSKIELESNSYVDETLKESFSDIVYRCSYKDRLDIKISLLFEHKSNPQSHIHLQLLKYILNIWESNVKQKQKLNLVIPILFYHGKTKWKYRRLSDVFKGMDHPFYQFIPDFDYLLTDLSCYSDQELKDELFQHVAVAITCLVMKNIADGTKLGKHLGDFLEIGKIYFEQEKGLKFLEAVLRYILQTTEIESKKVIESVKKISEKGGIIAMTTAEKLREEGRREAMASAEKLREEGKIEGRRQVIIEAIEIKFGSISKDLKNQIENLSDIKQLSGLFQICLKANSMDEILQFLKKGKGRSQKSKPSSN